MKTFILTAFALTMSFQSFAQDFSIFDLYEVVEKTDIEVIDPRSTNMNEALRKVHKMTPRFNDYECRHEFLGTRLTFDQVMKLLPREIAERTKKTRVGDRLLKSLRNSTFTAAESSCHGNAWSSYELAIVENNLKFGLSKIRHMD